MSGIGTTRWLAMLAAMALVGGQAVAQLAPRTAPAPAPLAAVPAPAAAAHPAAQAAAETTKSQAITLPAGTGSRWSSSSLG